MKRNLFMHGHLETWDLEPGTKLYGDVPIYKKDPETLWKPEPWRRLRIPAHTETYLFKNKVHQ